MTSTQMTIGELADRAGLSRRAIRFYVQRGLLPAPYGKGRGSTYTQEHVDRIQQVQELQAAGHSLVAIKKILEGGIAAELPHPKPSRKRRVVMSAGLWSRLRLADGIELNLDATKYNASVEDLMAIQDAVRSVLNLHRNDYPHVGEGKNP